MLGVKPIKHWLIDSKYVVEVFPMEIGNTTFNLNIDDSGESDMISGVADCSEN